MNTHQIKNPDLRPQKISFERIAFPSFLLAGLGLAAGLLWSRRISNSPGKFAAVDRDLKSALKEEDQRETDQKNRNYPKQVDLEPLSE